MQSISMRTSFHRSINGLMHRLNATPTATTSTSKINPTNKHLAQKLQPSHKRAQKTRNTKMADRRPNIQPRPLISHHIKEIQRHHVRYRHHHHEQRAGRDLQPAVEDAQVGADDGKGDEDFEDQEGALAEGVENGDEAVDAVEGERGDGGDVAGAEEGGLQEEEEKEGDAGVGEVEGAVVVGLSVDCCRGFGAWFLRDYRSSVCAGG